MQSVTLPLITKSPAKVLIAGGYGVLEEDNLALTLALKNCFYSVCTSYDPSFS